MMTMITTVALAARCLINLHSLLADLVVFRQQQARKHQATWQGQLQYPMMKGLAMLPRSRKAQSLLQGLEQSS